jgi:hypothetical protein
MTNARHPPFTRAAEIDIAELHRLWIETDIPQRLLADRFHTTSATIAGIIRRRRLIDGLDRWPHREGAADKNRAKPKRAKPLKPGQPTLPPLDSVERIRQ